MSRRTSSSPGARGARWRGVGRSDGGGACLNGGGRRRRRSGRPGRLGPARDDSLGVEVEDDGAELVVAFDLDWEVLNGGDVRWTAAERRRPWR